MNFDDDRIAEALSGDRESIESSNRLENLIEIFEALDIERDYDALADRNHASLVKADDLEDIALRAIALANEEVGGSLEEGVQNAMENVPEELDEEQSEGENEDENSENEEAQVAYNVARERLNDKYTRDELRSGPATEHEIEGRWDMSKDDLLDAVLAEMDSVAERDESAEATDGGEVEA